MTILGTGCLGNWWSNHPWKVGNSIEYFGPWLIGAVRSVRFAVRLSDLQGFFQLQQPRDLGVAQPLRNQSLDSMILQGDFQHGYGAECRWRADEKNGRKKNKESS